MEVTALAHILPHDTDLLLLDLDNTLYEYNRCHEFALSKLIAACEDAFNLPAEQVHQLYYECRKTVSHIHTGTANSHSRLFYIQGMVEKALGYTNVAQVVYLHQIYWNSYIIHMELYDDAIAFLQQYKEANIPVVMVTDMLASVQFQKIDKLGIGSYFNYIVTSEEAGVEKPHPYIFELAINKALQLNPGIRRIAVVGDNIKKDTYSSSVYQVTIYHILRDE